MTPKENHPVELLDSTEREKYLVQSKIEIEFLLRELKKHGTLISVFFSETEAPFLSNILEVNQDNIIIDASQHSEINHKAAQATHINVSTRHNKIKIQFSVDRMEPIHFDGHAFKINTPTSVLRIQRREYYRLTTPVYQPVLCHIPSPHNPSQLLSASVVNISGEGAAILAQVQDAEFSLGAVFKNCQIMLPDMGRIYVSLQIKNIFDVTLRNGDKVRRYGCFFLDLNGYSVTALQKYIARMERDTVRRSVVRMEEQAPPPSPQ